MVKQAVGEMSGTPRALLGIKLIDEVDDAEEARSFALKDGVPSQGRRQMRLAGSSSAHKNDIAGRATGHRQLRLQRICGEAREAQLR